MTTAIKTSIIGETTVLRWSGERLRCMSWRYKVGLLIVAFVGVLAVFYACRQDGREEVLRVSRAIPDGGGYCALSDTGVGRDLNFEGIRILKASRTANYYCSGFTFEVFLVASGNRGLLHNLSSSDIALLQKEWYGATSASRVKQGIYAMQRIGVGRELAWDKAQPGDFVFFSRPKSGHSVVFESWIYGAHGDKIGFRYRSAQPSTKGVGTEVEYFSDSSRYGATVMKKYFFVGRLN